MSQFFVNSSGGSGGEGILTINDIGPDGDNNFTIQPLNGIALAPITNGITIQNTEGASEFVVDSQGNANYTTIQAAITAAALVADSTTPQTVYIWPGTYAEDLSFKPWVNLFGLGDPRAESAVFVQGTNGASYSDPLTGNFSIENIKFYANAGGGTLSFASGSTSEVSLENVFSYSDNGGTAFQCTGGGMTIFVKNSYFNTNGSTGGNIYNITNGIYLNFFSVFSDYNTSFQQSVFSGSPIVDFSNCYISDAFLMFGSVTMRIINSTLITGGSGYSAIQKTGCNVTIYNSVLQGDATYLISGTGALTYDKMTSISGIPLDPGLTVTQLESITGPISFDEGIATLDTATQAAVNLVVLGTGTSALNTVSDTGTSGQVLTSNGNGNDPTWQDTSSGVYTIASITFSDSPYTVDITTTNYVSVDTSGGDVLVLIPNSPTQASYLVVKDASGNAATNNITISSVSGSVPIDTIFNYIVSSNFESYEFIFNTDHYEVF